MHDHFLIIGAGPVGLAIAKSLKLGNVPYHQVEADDDVGGNWYHGVYNSINILSSREATEYPDFPMPLSYPDFPSRDQMYAYYKLYADHYQLKETIQFNTKVTAVTPVENNLWQVVFESGTINKYKGVMVCNGHHWSKNYPQYDGLFTGESIHSKDYKSSEQLKDKKVLVIGAGNSAFDISSQASRVSKKSFLSVKRGIWIFPKTFMGKPLSHYQRFNLPTWMKMSLGKLMLKIAIGSHEAYGLPKPTIKIFDRHPTIDTDTLINIKNGRIIVKGPVKKFMGSEVEFIDGTREEIDMIVYATGFNVDLPFLPTHLNRVEKKCIVKVYGFGMYEDYKGLFIIGWFQPRGGIGSLIGPYADLITNLVKVQEKFETPIGSVLKEMGEKLPDTHLFGGPEFLHWVNKLSRQLGRIEKTGARLDAVNPGFKNKILNEAIKPILV